MNNTLNPLILLSVFSSVLSLSANKIDINTGEEIKIDYEVTKSDESNILLNYSDAQYLNIGMKKTYTMKQYSYKTIYKNIYNQFLKNNISPKESEPYFRILLTEIPLLKSGLTINTNAQHTETTKITIDVKNKDQVGYYADVYEAINCTQYLYTFSSSKEDSRKDFLIKINIPDNFKNLVCEVKYFKTLEDYNNFINERG